MFPMRDKVIVITGGVGGIGSQIVKECLKDNPRHITILDIDASKGTEFEKETNKNSNVEKVNFMKCNITKEDDIQDCFEKVLLEQGRIDVLINNAGILNDSKEVYRREIQVNVLGLITASLKAYELMQLDHGGVGGTIIIINVSSVLALAHRHVLPVYIATKGAVLQFSNCLGMSENYSRSGVRVIAVCFGMTRTNLVRTGKPFDEESVKEIKVAVFPMQTPESAAKGLLEVFKTGVSGSTWVVHQDLPPKDISNNVEYAYKILENSFNDKVQLTSHI